MNFVFWFVIILCLMGIWLALSPLFESLGELIFKTKNSINNEKEDKK